jgi:hypothetical protein
MSSVTEAAPATFKTAGWLKRNLRTDDSLLLRLVALGQVRVQKTSMYPRYCLEDVQAFLRQENRYAGDQTTTFTIGRAR